MKITAAAFAQPQSEAASLGSGNASGREHDQGFAQLLRGSLGKTQGNSSPPAATPATATTTPTAAINSFGDFGADTPPRLPARASRTPLAPFGDFGSNTTPSLPARASRAPLAATTTATATTRPFADYAGSKVRPASDSRTAAQPTAAAIPRAAGDLAGLPSLESGEMSTGVVITTSATLGGRLIVVEREASSPAPATVSAAQADAASAADGSVRAALASAETATATAFPFGDFGSDSSPHLPTPASHAPLAPFGDFGSNTTPRLPARASHAPLATTPSGSSAAQSFVRTTADSAAVTAAVRPFARIALARAPATTTATATAATTPFAGFGSDSSPRPPAPASHAPLAATTSGSSAVQGSARTAAHSAASTATGATATTAASIAPAADQASEPAELAQTTHDDSAASKNAPPPVAGATSRSDKPESPVPQPAAPTTIVNAQPAVDAKATTGPALQPLAEGPTQTSAVRTEKRTRTQDRAHDSDPEPSSSLPSFVAAPNSTTPSVHTHSQHSTETAAVPENRPALPIGEGKQTTDHAAPASSLPAQIAHQPGQTALGTEAQVTTTLPQALPQVALPLPTPATSAAAADLRAAAHLPAQAAPLAAQAARDDGLSMNVLPHSAHMAIESPDGDLDLHMRVRQGSAEITVGGSMAHLFETRAPEARAALAGEGLALGRFDSGQQGGGQQNQPTPELPETTGESPTAYRPHQSAPLPDAPADGRIHVTA